MPQTMAGDGKAALSRVVLYPLLDAPHGDRRARERAFLDEEHLLLLR